MMSIWFSLVLLKGLMDSSSRSAYFNSWNIHLHDWPTFHNDTSQRDRRVDTANQICSKARCRSVRLPDFHPAHQKLFGEAESCRWVLNAMKIRSPKMQFCTACMRKSDKLFLFGCKSDKQILWKSFHFVERQKFSLTIFKLLISSKMNVIKSSFHSRASTKEQ